MELPRLDPANRRFYESALPADPPITTKSVSGEREPWLGRRTPFPAPLRKIHADTVYVYVYMATKTISITRQAYDRLKARKGPQESFSDVILRLTEHKPLAEYAGMLSKSSVRAIRGAIEEARRERRKLDVRA